ncbi:MAG TPA: enoyl-CoA hydratase-related protein [Methylocystis sp.]|nr:enoyl-CoA hydratase-related protein [Methylocystis sp.]
MKPKILSRAEDGVLRLTFNRPDKKNALDRDMYRALVAGLEGAQADDAVRAVLLAGAGADFTAGNDINDFLSFDAREEFPALSFVRALADFDKPLVAAVAGDAVGVGATMLLHCDLAYAAPSAKFRFPFVDLGLVPEAGASLLAPRLFGRAKAAQYLLLCENFGAEEALRLGLVNEVVEENGLFYCAEDAARRLAQKPVEALRATRRLLRGDPSETLARIDVEARLFRQALEEPALQARLAAFFAKDR